MRLSLLGPKIKLITLIVKEEEQEIKKGCSFPSLDVSQKRNSLKIIIIFQKTG